MPACFQVFVLIISYTLMLILGFKILWLFHYGAYTDMYLLVIFSTSLTILGGLLPCRRFSVFLVHVVSC